MEPNSSKDILPHTEPLLTRFNDGIRDVAILSRVHVNGLDLDDLTVGRLILEYNWSIVVAVEESGRVVVYVLCKGQTVCSL